MIKPSVVCPPRPPQLNRARDSRKPQIVIISLIYWNKHYLFLIGFPFAPASGVAETRQGPPLGPGEVPSQLHVLQSVIRGCEFDPGNAAFDVLLGMDVIRTGTLVVQGDGSFSFSF